MSAIAIITLYGFENLGIRMISSILKKEKLETHTIFLKNWVNNDIQPPSRKEIGILLTLLKELKVDVVGLGFTSPFLKIAQDVTLQIKEELTLPVIWGGIHATVNPEQCLSHCDVVCRGEAEYAMLDFAKAFMQARPFYGIKNLCYKNEEKIVYEDMRLLIQDLDALLFPDYDSHNKFIIEEKLFLADPVQFAKDLGVFASRGCPFDCSYCYNSLLRRLYGNKGYCRRRSVDNVLSEIEYVLSRYRSIRSITFEDDTFVFEKDWIMEFCKKYKKRIGFLFSILSKAECCQSETLAELKLAGLRKVSVGIESSSPQKSLAVYKRELSSQKIRDFSLVAHKLKLEIFYDVIVDSMFETFEEKMAPLDFLLTLPRPFHLLIYSLTVFPGTELAEHMLMKGLIKPENIEGQAHKTFYQYRFSFLYPRDKKELFYICMLLLLSKSFVSKRLIKFLKKKGVQENIFSSLSYS